MYGFVSACGGKFPRAIEPDSRLAAEETVSYTAYSGCPTNREEPKNIKA